MFKRWLVGVLLALTVAAETSAAPAPEGPAFRGKRFADWMQMLKAGKPRERLKAIETLALIGPEARSAVPALIAALKDTDQEVREAAAAALGEVGPGRPEVVDALAQAAKEPAMHGAIGPALCRCGPAGFEVIESVFAREGFRSPIPRAVLWAPPRRDYLPILMAALREPDTDLRRYSARAVARLGRAAKKAAPALRTIMQKDEDDYIRIEAAEALVEVADPKISIPALVELMRGDGRYSRRDAAGILGWMGSRARAAVPDLLDILKNDPDREVREAAAVALWQIDRRKIGIHTLIVGLAESDNPFYGIALALSLEEIGADAVPDWIEALTGRKVLSKDLRDESAIVAALGQLLARNDADVRRQATRLLGVLGSDDSAAVAALAGALRDKDRHVRREAARVLVLLGKETAAVVPVLHEILRQGSREDADRAAWLLWRLEGKSAALVPMLIARLEVGEHDDDDDHVFAAEILGWIGRDARPAAPALRKVLRLRRASDPLRRAAADALGNIGGPIEAVLPDLLDAAEDDDPLLRVAAVRALGAWGEAARPARFVVAGRRHDKNPLVRRAAAAALQRVQPATTPPRFPPLDEDEPLVFGWTLREWLKPHGPNDMLHGGSEARLAVLRASASSSPVAVRFLAEALKDRRIETRARAAAALIELGPEAREAVPLLLAQRKDRHAAIRGMAEDVLRRIDPETAATSSRSAP